MSRASFGTLPLELKAVVVEMTSEQEDAWKERVEDGIERASHINGLSSLALVNKELRELAAKHQFKELSSRRASQLVFRLIILPHHSRHINVVYFTEDSEEEAFDNVLAILPQLASLRAISFAHKAAVALFGPAVALHPVPGEGTDAGRYRASMLNHISSQITTLSLYDFTPAASLALILQFPNLKELYFFHLQSADDDDEVRSLISAIATLRHLSHLVIDLSDQSTLGWLSEAFSPFARNPPPIRTLQLLWFPLDHHTFNFINLFSATLDTLRLELHHLDAEPDLELATRDPLQLPHLAHLSIIRCQNSGFEDIARLLTSTSTLSSLSFALTEGGWLDPTMPALVGALGSQVALRRLQLGEMVTSSPSIKYGPSDDLASPSTLAAYADLIRTRGFDASVLDRYHLTPFHPEAKLDYTESEGENLVEILGRTLDFVRIELKRMVAEGNVARAVGWVAKLKPFEEERLAWKD